MAGMMVLFWAGIAALIAVVARTLIGPTGGDQSMDTLRRRLASGELTQEEVERTRPALQGERYAECARLRHARNADAAPVSPAPAGRRRPRATSAEPVSSRTRPAPPRRLGPRTGSADAPVRASTSTRGSAQARRERSAVATRRSEPPAGGSAPSR